MSRKSDSRWPTSAYAPHVSLARDSYCVFKVRCEHCGAHEMIPDVTGYDPAEIRSFNMSVQSFTTNHAGCPERGEK